MVSSNVLRVGSMASFALAAAVMLFGVCSPARAGDNACNCNCPAAGGCVSTGTGKPACSGCSCTYYAADGGYYNCE